MKSFSFEEIAAHRLQGGKRFPLGFRRQPDVCPACERIRFEEAQMAYRLGRIEQPCAVQSERRSALVLRIPVERRGPTLRDTRIPAFGEPELGTPIAAVRDE